MRRIAVAGEIYSANRGDQAIHACMAYLLKRLDPTVEVLSIDLSGRNAPLSTGRTLPEGQTLSPGQSPDAGRMRLSQRAALLSSTQGFRLPLVILKSGALLFKLLRGQAAGWRRTLETADALVIGGGQLLMDDALNFPLKIAALVQVARSLDLPYHFAACGVGSGWSRVGGQLFRSALRQAGSVSVRDQLSQDRLQRLVPGAASRVTMDPAIWAGEVYPMRAAERAEACLGLGVINHREANLHLPQGKRFSKDGWMHLWIDLVEHLARENRHVELFTTGSPADQVFAAALFSAAGERGWSRVYLASPPDSTEQLLATLRSYSAVAAARMHANVLANAVGVPSAGLVWDQKVRAYYTETGRAGLCFELTNLPPGDVADACAAMWGSPFPQHVLEQLKQRALEAARLVLEPRSG